VPALHWQTAMNHFSVSVPAKTETPVECGGQHAKRETP
jgi:hypothetical protein